MVKVKNIILLSIVCWFACYSFAVNETNVQIYLPREITVRQNEITLGEICILSGDEQANAKIEAVGLGRILSPGQIIKIDRNTVVSRLASNGIEKDNIAFTGAEYVRVKLESKKITKDKIIKEAEKFLRDEFKNREDIVWELTNNVEDVVLDGDVNDVRFKADLGKYGNSSRSRIVVLRVYDGQKVISQQSLQFQLSFKSKQIVAKEFIGRGQEITEQNVELREIITNNTSQILTQPPYGLVVKRDIYPGQVVRNGSFGSPKPEKIVKRNQSVLVRLQLPGLVLTVQGQVLEDGYLDDLVKVKVKVTEQEKIIVGRVAENGTIEPVM